MGTSKTVNVVQKAVDGNLGKFFFYKHNNSYNSDF